MVDLKFPLMPKAITMVVLHYLALIPLRRLGGGKLLQCSHFRLKWDLQRRMKINRKYVTDSMGNTYCPNYTFATEESQTYKV